MYDVKDDLKRLFELLDTTEESDSGKVFKPITISCCRTMMLLEMEGIFKRLKGYVQ